MLVEVNIRGNVITLAAGNTGHSSHTSSVTAGVVALSVGANDTGSIGAKLSISGMSALSSISLCLPTNLTG